MKAAVHTRYGPPEVVRIRDVGKPAAGDSELLVRVHATTVNKTDAHYRAGKPFPMRPLLSGLFRPKATVLGNEFAGLVETVGTGVQSFKGRRPGFRLQRRVLRSSRRVSRLARKSATS